MSNVYIEQILNQFNAFINLCKLDNWPNEGTEIEQIRKAFLYAKNIEKCTNKMKNINILHDFLNVLNQREDTTALLVKNCMSDPPKYILKKVIVSSLSIANMDKSFNIFLDLFSEEKLELALSNIMLEVASKTTLLKYMPLELPETATQDLKSLLFLSKYSCVEDSVTVILGMLNNCTLEIMNMLIVCLLNEDIKYALTVKNIANAFEQVMLSHDASNKTFWEVLLDTEEDKFIEMCKKHNCIFELYSQALITCGKILDKKLSGDNFHIQLTYSKLSWKIRKICSEQELKLMFLNLLKNVNADMKFWNRLLK